MNNGAHTDHVRLSSTVTTVLIEAHGGRRELDSATMGDVELTRAIWDSKAICLYNDTLTDGLAGENGIVAM